MGFLERGVIEGFCGPMASGKTSALLKRIDPLRYIQGVDFIGFRPEIDTRDVIVRGGNNFIDWKYISEKNPYDIINYVSDKHDLVAIDEIQFFEKGIVSVILKLQKMNKNVVFAGLDSDFKGDAFGSMKELMFYANKLKKLYAVCTECGSEAYYTQRLIDGKPAPVDSEVELIDGSSSLISYEPRCFSHHYVPGKKD